MQRALFLLFAVFFLLLPTGRGAVILNEGDSYTFEFSSMEENSGLRWAFDVSAYFGFSDDPLDNGDTLKVEFFEDSILDTPWLSGEYEYISPTADPSGFYIPQMYFFTFQETTTQWADFQGVVRFTMLVGSVNLSAVSVERNFGDDSYYANATIPEPTAASLVGIGAVIAFLSMRRTPLF